MDNKECSTKPECAEKRCCPVRFLLSALAVFVVIFLFEGVFHGVFMMPYYKATASLWRPEADMKNFMYIGLIRQLGTALVFTRLLGCVLKKSECECPIKTGIKFGFKVGLLIGLANFGSYQWLPLPGLQIPVMWLVGNAVLGVLMGVTLGVICKMTKKGDCKKTDGA
jgi:hypothetical protein